MKKLLIFSLIIILVLPSLWSAKPGEAQSGTAPNTTFTLGEGIDFATRVLADPWDMSNFTDISQGLNLPSGNYLDNIQVNNGVFSARTTGSYSEFYPLYPGYEPGLNSGKIGARFPIDSSMYSCAYVALYANWSTSDNNYLILFWARDRLLDKSGVYGQAYGNPITKNQWRLFKIDLKNPPHLNKMAWTSQQYWQAFRVTPSLVANTQFYVDWVRLTNCQPVYANLSGLKSGTYSLWLGTGSPERQILVINSFSTTGSYAWDVQGLAAGSYTYYVKNQDGSDYQKGQVNIIGSPIVKFTSPSPYSGPDYANHQGNSWDMDPSDATRIDCASYSFNNGILYLDTASRACAGPGANEADPHIFLNTLVHGNLSSYRYFSFSSSTSGYPWSVPDLGMIVRLFWSLHRNAGGDCWYGSRAIALDNGWQTYTVDLYDPLNGTPEEKTPTDCPLVSWRDQAAVGPVVSFRIDPNENITGGNMHQEFDWIRLTKVEQVSQGKQVKIRVLLNKPPSDVTLNFYYTTQLSQQTQKLAQTYPRTVFAAPYNLYLPQVLTFDPNYDLFVNQLPADVTYLWNTSGVAPGEYYVCAQAGDGYNQATYCSQVPVQINP